MTKQSLIVKLTGCRAEGRSVDGEYEGGATLAEARAEAAFFAEHCPEGRIRIVRATDGGDTVTTVEVYRAA